MRTRRLDGDEDEDEDDHEEGDDGEVGVRTMVRESGWLQEVGRAHGHLTGFWVRV